MLQIEATLKGRVYFFKQKCYNAIYNYPDLHIIKYKLLPFKNYDDYTPAGVNTAVIPLDL